MSNNKNKKGLIEYIFLLVMVKAIDIEYCGG